MFIANAVFAQRLCQRFPAKLRITFRTRKHPHIGDEFDPVLFQERKEDVDLARRMYDGFCGYILVLLLSSVPDKFRDNYRTNMKKSLLSAIVGFATLALMQGADTQTQPAAGTAAPEFSLSTSDGSQVSLKDFKGKWVVLYFYPKDFTSGCTMEAKNFQRDLAQYDKTGAVISGREACGQRIRTRVLHERRAWFSTG